MGASPSRPNSSNRLAVLSDLSGSIRRRQDSGSSSATGVEMDGKPNDLNEPLLPMGAQPAPPAALVLDEGDYVGAGGGVQRRRPSELEAWQFPGWGQTQRLTVSSPKPVGRPNRVPGSPMPAASPVLSRGSDGAPSSSPHDPSEPPQGSDVPVDWEHGTAVHAHAASDEDPEPHKLGQFSATAIAGNDILSSVLYTAGLCGSAAGVYAPISMALICVMLYLFRKVYGEVGSALPLNGGAYNALLNTTSKATASVAACLTILSYVATGVVAAADANYYLQQVWEGLNIYVGTIVLLAAFAFLNFMGLTESAFVALLIFVFHTLVLTVLLILGTVQLAREGFGLLTANYHSPLQPSLGIALVYGFSAASLGITGFETSSNYIEEQKEGVFPKTLRNMWWVVLIFNPTLVFLAFCLVPIDQIMDPSVQPVVLSTMARTAAGRWFEILVSVDAFLVLSGSVLTAYVGVTGLFKRLAGDRCLPEFLLQTNKWRGTNHWIILLFLGICCSLYGVVAGKVDDLAGVYSIAFLCVMALFAVANMLLKYKRNELPRNIRASWPGVSVALLCVLTALGITVARNTDYDKWFAIYFIATALLFAISFNRVQLLKIIMYSMRYLLRKTRFGPSVDAYITKAIKDINQNPVVFFSKTAKLSVLNKAILYIRDNELTNWVRIVHVATSEDKVPSNFVENVRLIDSIYPKLRIDAVLLQGEFGPDAIETVSQEYHIPKNMVFITCPTTNFRHKIGSLGGVRVITHSSSD